MTRNVRVVLGVGAVVAGLVVAAVVAAAGGGESSAAGDRCCLTNPRYTGTCEVTLGEDETCAGVLAYLNNPNSTGKAYCGGTSIRGGWKKVACE